MSTTLEQLQYGFDRDSRRVWRQRATTQGWDNAYVYDSLSQVIGDDRGELNLAHNAIAGIPSNGARWQYDETGNWHGYQTLADGAATLSQARRHDKGNRLMEVSEAAAMRTDRAGRMLETVPGPDGDWNSGYEITWDAWSRIVGVASVEGETITPVAVYAYDGLTRRITRYTNAEDVALHSYYNDEWRPVEERREGSSSALQYLWGSRHRDDLVRRDTVPVAGGAMEDTHYVLMDYFSPAAVVDVSGDLIERYQFSAFGLRTILSPSYQERSESEIGFEFSFQGQFEDVETGWLNFGYRYYLPAIGRWGCKDPIGEIGGFALYRFTDNEPINWLDKLGLTKKPCDFTVVAGHLDDIEDREMKQEKENKKKKNTPCDKVFGASCKRNSDGDYVWSSKERRDQAVKDPKDKWHDIAKPDDPVMSEEIGMKIREAESEAPAACDDPRECCSEVRLKVDCSDNSYTMRDARKGSDGEKLRSACRYSNTYSCSRKSWSNALFN